MCYFVYILYSESTDSYYKGQTGDLSDRLYRHNHGQEKSTKSGVPWIVVLSIKLETRSEAVLLERKLKNLSRKRLVSFIKKYGDDVAGPDDADF